MHPSLPLTGSYRASFESSARWKYGENSKFLSKKLWRASPLPWFLSPPKNMIILLYFLKCVPKSTQRAKWSSTNLPVAPPRYQWLNVYPSAWTNKHLCVSSLSPLMQPYQLPNKRVWVICVKVLSSQMVYLSIIVHTFHYWWRPLAQVTLLSVGIC